MPESRPLRVFLCHASQDKLKVRELCKRLKTEGWIDPWFDEVNILPGQDWEFEIKKAIKNSDIVLVILSSTSIGKEGFVQKEIKLALDVADEKPDGTIYIIPIRLDECKVPERLKRWQWFDYFNNSEYSRLLEAFRVRSKALGVNVQEFKEIIKPLSFRETEVLSCVMRGMSNKEIAGLLGLSHQTIKNHVTSILRKLNVENRTAAILYVLSENLLASRN